MTQDEKHAVALMRYGAIAPLISGTKDDFQGLDDYYRAAAEKPYPAPDGSRTMKDQWMASLDMRAFHSLNELRAYLYAFVNAYNQAPHSSLGGKSPVDRFFSEPDHIRRLDDAEIERAFLLEIERTVSADSVIVIDHTEYEVDYRFAKRRIRLRYSPDLKEIFVVEQDASLTPVKLLHKHDNSMIKRNKTYLCRGDE